MKREDLGSLDPRRPRSFVSVHRPLTVRGRGRTQVGESRPGRRRPRFHSGHLYRPSHLPYVLRTYTHPTGVEGPGQSGRTERGSTRLWMSDLHDLRHRGLAGATRMTSRLRRFATSATVLLTITTSTPIGSWNLEIRDEGVGGVRNGRSYGWTDVPHGSVRDPFRTFLNTGPSGPTVSVYSRRQRLPAGGYGSLRWVLRGDLEF